MPTVRVKLQKDTLSAVEIDTTQPPYVFKAQLCDLTGLPPERQKIIDKGGLLKFVVNDFLDICPLCVGGADWSNVGVKELMMMWTANEIVKAPEKMSCFHVGTSRRRSCLSAFEQKIWPILGAEKNSGFFQLNSFAFFRPETKKLNFEFSNQMHCNL